MQTIAGSALFTVINTQGNAVGQNYPVHYSGIFTDAGKYYQLDSIIPASIETIDRKKIPR